MNWRSQKLSFNNISFSKSQKSELKKKKKKKKKIL